MSQLARAMTLSGPVATLLFQLSAVHLDESAMLEFPFAKDLGRRWRFDIAFPDHNVAVEVDGGSWVGGRHTSGSGFEKDLEKMNAAVELGWKVLRFTPRMIDDGTALATLERVLA